MQSFYHTRSTLKCKIAVSENQISGKIFFAVFYDTVNMLPPTVAAALPGFLEVIRQVSSQFVSHQEVGGGNNSLQE